MPSETIVLADIISEKIITKQPLKARVTITNAYGPIENCSVKVSHPNNKTNSFQLIEELITTDEHGTQLRSTITQPIYSESPWSSTFDGEVTLTHGKNALSIILETTVDNLNITLSDWVIDL